MHLQINCFSLLASNIIDALIDQDGNLTQVQAGFH